MTNIEKRLHNAEVAICTLASIVSEFLPVVGGKAVVKCLEDFNNAVVFLGGDVTKTLEDTGHPFLTGHSDDD